MSYPYDAHIPGKYDPPTSGDNDFHWFDNPGKDIKKVISQDSVESVKTKIANNMQVDESILDGSEHSLIIYCVKNFLKKYDQALQDFATQTLGYDYNTLFTTDTKTAISAKFDHAKDTGTILNAIAPIITNLHATIDAIGSTFTSYHSETTAIESLRSEITTATTTATNNANLFSTNTSQDTANKALTYCFTGENTCINLFKDMLTKMRNNLPTKKDTLEDKFPFRSPNDETLRGKTVLVSKYDLMNYLLNTGTLHGKNDGGVSEMFLSIQNNNGYTDNDYKDLVASEGNKIYLLNGGNFNVDSSLDSEKITDANNDITSATNFFENNKPTTITYSAASVDNSAADPQATIITKDNSSTRHDKDKDKDKDRGKVQHQDEHPDTYHPSSHHTDDEEHHHHHNRDTDTDLSYAGNNSSDAGYANTVGAIASNAGPLANGIGNAIGAGFTGFGNALGTGISSIGAAAHGISLGSSHDASAQADHKDTDTKVDTKKDTTATDDDGGVQTVHKETITDAAPIDAHAGTESLDSASSVTRSTQAQQGSIDAHASVPA